MTTQGRTAIVTGAGAGIGRATIRAFAGNLIRVVAVDIDAARVHAVADEIRSGGGCRVPVVGDVASEATAATAVEIALAEFGHLDMVFNNAGIEHVATVLETPSEDWARVMEVNVGGARLMARTCLPIMMRQRNGIIVNNASDAGIRGMKMAAAYSVSKAALVQLTRSIAMDYAEFGHSMQLRLSRMYQDGSVSAIQCCGRRAGRNDGRTNPSGVRGVPRSDAPSRIA